MQPNLARSDIVPWINLDAERVHAYARLDPESGLLLQIVNHHEKAASSPEQLSLELNLPEWIKPSELYLLTPSGPEKLPLENQDWNSLVLPTPATAAGYLLQSTFTARETP